MNGEWCYFKSVFSKKECIEILTSTKNMVGRPAALGVNGERRDEQFRRSNIKFIRCEEHPHLEFVFDKLWKLASEANNDFFNFHLSKLSFLQLAEYTAQDRGEYKNHHDVFWLNDSPHHRKLSAMLQLTDPAEYEGGDFRFEDVQEHPNYNEIRTQGTVLFFPSFLTHRAEMVTKGTRHSIVGWIEGPKWR